MTTKSIRLHVLLALFVFALGQYRSAANETTPRVEFAKDPNANFTVEFPRVAKGGKVYVRVSWEAYERPDDSKSAWVVYLMGEKDFKSANVGQVYWSKGKYVQRLAPVTYVAYSKRSTVFLLDLGERKAGEMGVANHWNSTTKQFENAPLAACPELSPGEYQFEVSVAYFPEPGKTVSMDAASFTVQVTE